MTTKLFASIVLIAISVLALGVVLFAIIEGIGIVIMDFTGIDIHEESRKKFAEWRGKQ